MGIVHDLFGEIVSQRIAVLIGFRRILFVAAGAAVAVDCLLSAGGCGDQMLVVHDLLGEIVSQHAQREPVGGIVGGGRIDLTVIVGEILAAHRAVPICLVSFCLTGNRRIVGLHSGSVIVGGIGHMDRHRRLGHRVAGYAQRRKAQGQGHRIAVSELRQIRLGNHQRIAVHHIVGGCVQGLGAILHPDEGVAVEGQPELYIRLLIGVQVKGVVHRRSRTVGIQHHPLIVGDRPIAGLVRHLHIHDLLRRGGQTQALDPAGDRRRVVYGAVRRIVPDGIHAAQGVGRTGFHRDGILEKQTKGEGVQQLTESAVVVPDLQIGGGFLVQTVYERAPVDAAVRRLGIEGHGRIRTRPGQLHAVGKGVRAQPDGIARLGADGQSPVIPAVFVGSRHSVHGLIENAVIDLKGIDGRSGIVAAEGNGHAAGTQDIFIIGHGVIRIRHQRLIAIHNGGDRLHAVSGIDILAFDARYGYILFGKRFRGDGKLPAGVRQIGDGCVFVGFRHIDLHRIGAGIHRSVGELFAGRIIILYGDGTDAAFPGHLSRFGCAGVGQVRRSDEGEIPRRYRREDLLQPDGVAAEHEFISVRIAGEFCPIRFGEPIARALRHGGFGAGDGNA